LGKRRDAWVKSLEQQHAQFRFLATPQIEAGALDKFKVLILPYSIAISDKEAREIERFMDRGGIVIGDDQTGRMDARCRWRKQALWTAGRKGFEVSGPRDLGLKREFGGEFLVDHPRLWQVAADRAAAEEGDDRSSRRRALTICCAAAWRRRKSKASPSQPALFVERPSKIAKLTIDKNLDLRLMDEAGAPVDLSVVRVEVSDPAGRLARQYSGNVTVKDGRAAYQIPFALSDANGSMARAGAGCRQRPHGGGGGSALTCDPVAARRRARPRCRDDKLASVAMMSRLCFLVIAPLRDSHGRLRVSKWAPIQPPPRGRGSVPGASC
jgi:hypothetical protein